MAEEFSHILEKEKEKISKTINSIVLVRALYNRIDSKIIGESFEVGRNHKSYQNNRVVKLLTKGDDRVIGLETMIYWWPELDFDSPRDIIPEPEKVSVWILISDQHKKPEDNIWEDKSAIGDIKFYLPNLQNGQWKGTYEAIAERTITENLIPKLMQSLGIKYEERERKETTDGLVMHGEYSV
jgi:hypothetical protein